MIFIATSGNQTVTGTNEADTIDMRNAGADGSFVSLAAGQAFSPTTGFDRLVSIENAVGSSGADALIGSAGANELDGGNGDDTLEGGGGNDTLTGGAGFDIATFSGTLADYMIDYSGDGYRVIGADDSDELTGVEALTFTGSPELRYLVVDDGANGTLQVAATVASDDDIILAPNADFSAEGRINIVDKEIEIRGALAGVSPIDNATAWASPDSRTTIDGINVTGTGGLVLDGVALSGTIQPSGPSGGEPHSGVQYLGTGGLSISNSLVSARQSIFFSVGVEVGYVDGDVSIDETLFTGYSRDPGIPAGQYSAYGVYFNTNSEVERNVTVTDSRFDLNGVENTGLRTYGIGFDGYTDASGDLEISGNEFNNLTHGVRVFDFANVLTTKSDFSGISGNVFTNSGEASGNIDNQTAFVIETGSNTSNGVLYSAFRVGTSAVDVIAGGPGADLIAGNGGDDTLIGGDGGDKIFGGDGGDTITGGAGNDAIDGGSGVDTAVYGAPRDAYTVAFTSSGLVVTGDLTNVDTLTGVERLDFTDQDVLIVGAGGYATIQAAVDAASAGDTIMVASGTYAETVLVNKDITLVGANSAVAGRDTVGRGIESVVTGGIYITGDGATVDGFRVTGTNATGTGGVERPYGVIIGADDVTLVNTVMDGGETPDGSDNGSRPFGTVAGVANVTVLNNFATNWMQGAYIVVGTTGTISGNLFDGNGNGIVTESIVIAIDGNDFRNSIGSHLAVAAFEDVDLNDFIGAGNTFGGTGSRPIGVFPNEAQSGEPQDVTGTDFVETFFGEFAAGSVSFSGRGGNDTLNGSRFNDVLNGDEGNDTIRGGDGVDFIDGGTEADRMEGGAGNDTFFVDNQADLVVEAAGEGADRVITSVNYLLRPAVEVETLSAVGGSTAINLFGNELSQRIIGNDGRNVINGYDGADTLSGLGGNDNLYGGLGNDRLIGGLGNDSFAFTTALNSLTNMDTITDFTNDVNNNDRFLLENDIFSKLTATGNINAAFFKANLTGTAEDSNDYIVYETDTGKLFYDADGNGTGASIQFALLSNRITLTAADFVVI